MYWNSGLVNGLAGHYLVLILYNMLLGCLEETFSVRRLLNQGVKTAGLEFRGLSRLPLAVSSHVNWPKYILLENFLEYPLSEVCKWEVQCIRISLMYQNISVMMLSDPALKLAQKRKMGAFLNEDTLFVYRTDVILIASYSQVPIHINDVQS